VSYTLSRGETLGVVGESGSGKSVSNLAIMGLLNRNRTNIAGEVNFGGRDLLTLPPNELRQIRGKDIAMIFQDPFACLPMYRVGGRSPACSRIPSGADRARSGRRDLGRQIPNARGHARDYPHRYSGGMQRA
jgi:ABC-type microcin C transport system duplicated ATPase subunit YejF